MKNISTTIKRKWLDQILSGIKTVEYKGATPFWRARLDKLRYTDEPRVITFLCGRESYKFKVKGVYLVGQFKVIEGTGYRHYYEIHLGEQIQKELRREERASETSTQDKEAR